MRTAAAFRSLGAIDAHNVARDSMLRWIALFTPAFGLLFRFAAPPVADPLRRQFNFDLVAYYPLLMSFLPLIAAGMIGTAVGFLLLDQRDDQTLTALLVTPLSLGDYLRYRLGGLMLLSVVFGAIMVPLAGLTATTPLQAVGVVMVPCIISYFVTGPWQSAFGVVPHYWALKVFWLFDEGATAVALVHALIGLVWQAVLLIVLVRHFSHVARR
jgi:fluoroquinolone transport system permease protein